MAIKINNYLKYSNEVAEGTTHSTQTNADELAKIIYDLYYWRSYLASIEVSYGETGKSFVREITTFTASIMTKSLVGMFVFIILVAAITNFVVIPSEPKSKSIGLIIFIIVLVIYLFLYILWFVMPIIYFRRILKIQQAKEERAREIENESTDSPNTAQTTITTVSLENSRVDITTKKGKELEAIEKNINDPEVDKLMLWLSISPFALRTIWVWILIVGFVNALAEISFDLYSKESLPTFATNVVRTLILVVISYIATNIISELLQLREQYVKGKEEMKSLETLIQDSTIKIEGTNKLIDKNYQEIKIASEVRPVFNAINDLRIRLVKSEGSSLDKSLEDFIQTLTEQILIYHRKLDDNYDEIINLWTLTTVYTNIKLQAELFEERNSLITEFQIFGKILNKSLSKIMELKKPSDDRQYEVYTVLVIPPSRFLNFNKILKDGKEIYASDENWQDFIKINQESKKENLRHHRHFISIVPNLGKTIFDGGESLFSEEVKKALQEPYWYNKDRGAFFRNVENDTGMEFYKYPTTTEEMNAPDDNFESKSLDCILDNYHYENCCKVLEIDLTAENASAKNLDNILYDAKSKKPIDYYAIREIKANEWILCFRTIYDENFDSAHINILHKQQNNQDEWSQLTNDLKQIFCLGEEFPAINGYKENARLGIKIFPITEYKDK